jgi:hypothetical protein
LTKRRPRIIAPQLANGESRVKDYGRLPESVKEGLRDIARHEGKSMSWVKEQVIIRYFKLDKPEYKPRNVK